MRTGWTAPLSSGSKETGFIWHNPDVNREERFDSYPISIETFLTMASRLRAQSETHFITNYGTRVLLNAESFVNTAQLCCRLHEIVTMMEIHVDVQSETTTLSFQTGTLAVQV